MAFNAEVVAELEVLSLFNLANHHEGLKIHHDATPQAIAAAERLHGKGLITLKDGGYLTDTGREAAQNTQDLLSLLETRQRT